MGARPVLTLKIRPKNEVICERLSQVFPLCFVSPSSGAHPRPLQRSIKHRIRKRGFLVECPCTRNELRDAVAWYCSRPEYRQAILNGEWRFDLDGSQIERLRPEDKKHAEQELLP